MSQAIRQKGIAKDVFNDLLGTEQDKDKKKKKNNYKKEKPWKNKKEKETYAQDKD